jgi:dTDP-L-rhamnose 4-epimerase
MRILVTGGAGFIGSHVVDRLVTRGHQVVVLDNLDPQVHGDNAEPRHILKHIDVGRIEFIRGDIRDFQAVEAGLESVDAVCHLAAAVGVGQSMYAPHYYTSVNVDGQGVLMEVMARAPHQYRKFVVASSMSIYGEGLYRCLTHGEQRFATRPEAQVAAGDFECHCPVCGTPMVPQPTPESKTLESTSIYALTKKQQEELALCFGGAYRIPTIALRFFNVYGSRQSLNNPYTGVAAIFMSRLKNHNAPIVFEDGLQSRDFVHVHDLADTVVRAIEIDGIESGVYNVCTGRPTSIAEVAHVLADKLGVAIAPEIVGKYRAGDIRHCLGDNRALAAQLGTAPHTTFAEGVDELLAWSARETATDTVEASVDALRKAGLVR